MIPKCPDLRSFENLHNISCTLLVSKVYESFLLVWAREEVSPRRTQFGGERGCSTEHYLLQTWETILQDLEDNRSSTLLASVDFSKEFNHISHQHCLKSFASHGASSQIIALLATFLRNRTMIVRINQAFSNPLPVTGGCPQGSLLGVFLFNLSIDDVELTPNHFLQDTDDDIRVGDLFNDQDTQFLRRAEQVINLDPDSSLLPSVNVDVYESDDNDSASFEENGRLLEISDTDLPNINVFTASTPTRKQLDYPFITGSPVSSSSEATAHVTDSDDSSVEFGFQLFAGVRCRPRRIIYSDEDSFNVNRVSQGL